MIISYFITSDILCEDDKLNSISSGVNNITYHV